MAVASPSKCRPRNRAQYPKQAGTQMNCHSAQGLGAGSSLVVCVPRNLKLGMSQYIELPVLSDLG